MNVVENTAPSSAVNWRHVGAFVALTFALTWLLDLAIFLKGGLGAPGVSLGLQLQMLLPAASAIILELFFFRESVLHQRQLAGRGRWFFYYFLLMTLIFAVSSVGAALDPSLLTIAAVVTQLSYLAGLVLLIVLRATGGGQVMARVRLSWGRARYWALFGIGIVAFYGLQTILNYVFGLGQASDLTKLVPPGQMDPTTLWLVITVQSVLVGPILGLVVAFGEEYGWRGYLQSELIKMGRVRGAALLGAIWGLWHAPIILMGYNYPGYPVLGVLLMTLYTVGLGFALSYAVLKSGSVLLAAYLHALNNQVIGYFMLAFYAPRDMALSFGIGVFGILSLAVVALLILRDPIWREGSGNTSILTAGEKAISR